jgi:putative transcriptional regulator
MLRVRLKADGRVVQILGDGSEQPLPAALEAARIRGPALVPVDTRAKEDTSIYARRVRARTRLTQAQFAAQIGVPIDTVRNWEQGKRAPRGPARALLKVIDTAPDVAFAVLADGRARG